MEDMSTLLAWVTNIAFSFMHHTRPPDSVQYVHCNWMTRLNFNMHHLKLPCVDIQLYIITSRLPVVNRLIAICRPIGVGNDRIENR